MKLQSIALVGLSLMFTSCMTHWRPLMSAEIISMKSTKFKKGSYKEGETVKEQYCFSPGDEEKALSYSKGDATIGLVDEVVMRAQKPKRKA